MTVQLKPLVRNDLEKLPPSLRDWFITADLLLRSLKRKLDGANNQPDSVATTVADLVADFNALQETLRT